ncbi:hypothetical protein SCG7086_DF_00010, partial [Chlamydiales bacterium SCGC AG-110-P3]
KRLVANLTLRGMGDSVCIIQPGNKSQEAGNENNLHIRAWKYLSNLPTLEKG